MFENDLISSVGWIMFPQKMFKCSTLVSLNVTVFGNKVFADDKVKMGSLRSAWIWYDWYLCKRGIF